MNTYEYQKLRGLKRKMLLIELRGGCCELCGYNKNIAALDFHHRDPKEKSTKLDMRVLSNSTMEFIISEFEKCDVVCSNCHRDIHSPHLTYENVKVLIAGIEDTVTDIKKYGKPKCLDCNKEINYGYKRCRVCSDINKRKVLRPEAIILSNEKLINGVRWCSEKYGVSEKTIRHWLKTKIE